MIKRLNIAAGVLFKSALTGPLQLELRINNFCNLNCIACFDHAPGLKKKKAEYLPLGEIKKILARAKKLDVKEIIVSADGEPLMHKDILPILTLVRKNGFSCTLFTNSTLLDKRLAEKIGGLVDNLRVSVWAGDAETYSIVHNGISRKVFYDLEKSLKSVADTKARLILYNTIFNKNHNNIKEMLGFAEEVGADEVFFTEMSPRPHTGSLALTKKQEKEVQDLAGRLKSRIKNNLKDIYRQEDNKKIPCYMGFSYCIISYDASVLPCCGSSQKDSMGSIREDNLEDIWYGRRYSCFRKKALKKKMPLKRCALVCPSQAYNDYLDRWLGWLA